MNKCYRLIWNEARQCWVAAAETARARGKRSVCSLLLAAAGGVAWVGFVGFVGATTLPATTLPATTLPSGGQLVAGQASITQTANTLTVQQSSNRAAIDWQTFNVGSQARVQFNQPSASSVTLNRVLDANPSQIFGQISANGQVFLSNASGIYFAPGASVDVGALLATTHHISNADFMAGSAQFSRSGALGSVVNDGQLTAALGGYVALLAPEVRNHGVVLAQMGTVVLAAGEQFALQFDAGRLTDVLVTPGTIAALVDNGHAVQAPGGLIILSAQAANRLQGSVVNNSGRLEATSLGLRNGRVVLAAGGENSIGNGNSNGNGNGTVQLGGTVDVSNATGSGGAISVTGQDIVLAGDARLLASGSSGGGTVQVGGGWQGSGGLAQAHTLRMQAGALIDASATIQGDGGEVVLWTDIHHSGGQTTAAGTILATGGALGGDGGRVETSGYGLDTQALEVRAGAPLGRGGQWLLDPFDYTINAAAASSIGNALTGGTSVTVDTANSTASGPTVGTGGVVSGLSGAGSITLSSAISKTGGAAATLTLNASGNIALNANISSSTGALSLLFKTASGDITTSGTRTFGTNGGDVTFWTNGNNTGSSGAINFAGTTGITTLGGNITLGGGAGTTAPTGYAVGSATNGNGIIGGNGLVIPVTLNAGGGNITLRGQGATGTSTAGVSLNFGSGISTTGAGSITLDGISGTGNSWTVGVALDRTNISTVDGAITIVGNAVGTTPAQSFAVSQQAGGSIGASGSGNVRITGTSGTPGAYGIYADSNTLGKASGTGTLTLAFDLFHLTSTAMAGNEALTLQPAGTSFAGASFSYPLAGLTVPATIRGLTIGSASNATPLSVGTLSIAGPISLLAPGAGGSIALGGSLTSTLAGAAITLNAGATTTLAANTTVTTSNGSISLGNVDAGTAGAQSLTLNSGTAAATLGTLGGTKALASLSVSSGALGLTGNVSTTGAQQYSTSGDITLGTSSALNAGTAAIGFNATGGALMGGGSAGSITGGSVSVTETGVGVLATPIMGVGTTLAKAGAGTLILSGNSSYSGVTTISAGTLQIGNGGTLGSIASTVNNSANLVFNRSDATLLASTVNNTGAGAVVFAGSGKVTVAYGGSITGVAAPVTINSGSVLEMCDGFSTACNLGPTNITINGELIYNIPSSAPKTLSKTFSGSGNLTLAGTSSYAGTTTVGASAKLAIGSGAATGAIGSGAIVNNGQLFLNHNTGFTLANAISGSGSLTLGKTTAGVVNASGGSNLLTGLLSYTGATAISAGALVLRNDSAAMTTSGFSGPGELTIEPGSTSFSSALNVGALFGSTLAGLTLGKSGNTAAITLAGATRIAGPISLYGGDLSLNAALTATGSNTITLQGSGTVMEGAGGYLVASKLLLLGGNATLTHASNDVATLAASGVGSLVYADSNALEIGTVGSNLGITNGINASGPVSVATLVNDLTLTQGVATSSSAANALVLNGGQAAAAGTSSGGNLVLSGSPVLAVGAGGVMQLLTGSLAGSTGVAAAVGSGSGNFRYFSDEASSGYTRALATDVPNALYREQPSLTLTATDQSVTYGTTPVLGTSVAGQVNGDTALQAIGTAATVSVSGSTSGAGHYTANTSHVLSAAGATSPLGYALAYVAGTLGVGQKALSYSGTVSTRDYNGSSTATLADSVAGVLANDAVGVAATGASFDTANAGVGKTVSVSGLSLSGADAANYSLASTASALGTIAPKELRVAAAKTYDGSTSLSGFVTLGGLVGGETLGYSGAVASNAHVASASKFVSSITLVDGTLGGLAANYLLPTLNALNAPVTISAAPLNATLSNTSVTKVYDGNTSAPTGFTPSYSVTGLAVGDSTATLANTGSSYNSAFVASANVLTVNGLSIASITGSNASLPSDYSLGSSSASVAASITLRPLNWSVDNSSATYGTLASAGASQFTGVVPGETLSATITLYQSGSNSVLLPALRTPVGAYDARVSGFGGATAANYLLASTGNSTGTLNIVAKPLTLTPTAIRKTYDGSTGYTPQAADLLAMATAAGVVSGDVLDAVSLEFATKNAANSKTVTASAARIGDGAFGDASGNYAIGYASASNGTIAPKTISVGSTPTAADKVYDGLTGATLSGGALAGGSVVAGDTVLLGGSGSFASATAGLAKTVHLAYNLSGGDAGNYQLGADTGSTTASISKAVLTMTANDAAALLGQPDPAFTARFNGFVNGEDASVLSSSSVTRSGADSAADTYLGVLLPTFSATNYQLSAVAGNFSILPAETLLIRLSGTSRVYGNSNPSLALVSSAQYLTQSGNVLRDVTVSSQGNNHYSYTDNLGTTGSFDVATSAQSDSKVDNYAIAVRNFTKVGTNFITQATQTGNLAVTQRATGVAIANGAPSKVYDGNTHISSAMVSSAASLSSLVGSDSVSVGGSGNFADKSVGSANKDYTLSGLNLSGPDAANYFLTSTDLSGSNGSITPRQLLWSVGSTQSTYGSTALAGTASLQDTLAGDSVAGTVGVFVSGSNTQLTPAPRTAAGLYDQKVTGLSGTDAANYALAASGNTLGTLTIQPKAITLAAPAISKVYDQGTAYSTQPTDLSAIALASGQLVAGDVLSSITLAYADKNAGSGKAVLASAGTVGDGVGGNATANYHISYAVGSDGSITPKRIGVATAPTAAGKVYDGLTGVALSGGSLGSGDVLAGDAVSLGSSGAFASANAGTARAVNLVYTLSGLDAGNYVLSASSASTAADITPAALTMTANAASKVVFEADPVFSASFSGFVNGEGAAVLSAVAVTRPDAGTSESAGTYANALVPSASSANYRITPVRASFTVVAAGNLQIRLANSSKIYGDALPTLSALDASYCPASGCSGNTFLRGLTLTRGSGNHYTFDDQNGTTGSFDVSTSASSSTGVGQAAITISNFTVSAGANFAGQQVVPGSLSITQRAATFAASNVSKVYDGAVAVSGASLALTNRVGLDDVVLGGTGLYTDKAAGSGKGYSFSGLSLSGAAAGNYFLGSTTLDGSDGVITAKPLHWSVDAATGTYGTLASVGAGRISGLIAGDSVSPTVTLYPSGSSAGVVPTLRMAAGLYDEKVSALVGPDAANYVLASSGNALGSLQIAAKPISLSANLISRVYDGTSSYTPRASDLNAMAAATDLVDGDVLDSIALAYADKNAGSGKTVTASLALVGDGNGGNATANYAIRYLPSSSGRIDAKTISVANAPTVAGKTYDGLTHASISGASLAAGAVVAGESVALQSSGSFADAHAGTAKPVNLVYALSGADAGNYQLASNSASATADIARATLTMTADAAAKIVFDNDPVFTAHYSGFVNGENDSVLSDARITRLRAGLDETSGSYAAALVPAALSNDYTLSAVRATFTIVPAGQLLLRVANASKVYGDTMPSLDALDARYCPLNGCVGSSAIRTLTLVRGSGNRYTFDDLNGSTGSFDISSSASSGTSVGNSSIGVSNFSTSGIANFSTQFTQNGNLSITQRQALPGSSGMRKVYDGSNLFSGASLTITNRVGLDDVVLGGTGLFSDKNVGSNKATRYSGLALTGSAAANYFLADNGFSASNGSITTRALTLGFSASDKVYDGSAAASVASTDNRVAGDTLNISGTAVFQAGKDVGVGKTVVVSGISLGGADALNYSISGTSTSASPTATTFANITPRLLTIGGAAVANKVYDGADAASAVAGSLAGMVGSETLLASVQSARFDTAHAGTGKAVLLQYALADGSKGGLASNYRLALSDSSTADILRRPVAVAADTLQKTQGQTDPALRYQTEAPSGGRGLLAGEQLSGSLSRVAGEVPGSYAIGQGSLIDANNPDYSIGYQAAALQIDAGAQTPLTTPPLNPLQPPLPPRVLVDEPPAQRPIDLSDLEPRSLGNTTLPGDANVEVRLVRDPSVRQDGLGQDGVDQDGLLQVRVPKELTGAGRGFRFPLPTELLEQMGADETLQITTLAGQPLPNWLRYQPETHSFVASAVPLGALPLRLLLRMGKRQWLVVIEEGSN